MLSPVVADGVFANPLMIEPGAVGEPSPAVGLTPSLRKLPSFAGTPPAPTGLSVEPGSDGGSAHAAPASGTDTAAAAAAVTNNFFNMRTPLSMAVSVTAHVTDADGQLNSHCQ